MGGLEVLFDQLEKAVDSLQAHAERLHALATGHRQQPAMRRKYKDATNAPTIAGPVSSGVGGYSSVTRVSLPNTNNNQFVDRFDRVDSTSVSDHRHQEWAHAHEASPADLGLSQSGGEPLTETSASSSAATDPHSRK